MTGMGAKLTVPLAVYLTVDIDEWNQTYGQDEESHEIAATLRANVFDTIASQLLAMASGASVARVTLGRPKIER